MGGEAYIKAGILTPDERFAKKVHKDISELGYSVAGEVIDDESVEIVLLDCRNGDSIFDFNYIKSNKIVIAIVNGMFNLSTEALSEYADVIFFPYSKEELITRIRLAAIRMNKQLNDNVYELEGFRINYSNYEVSVEGRQIDLTYKEYELLRHLVSTPGRVFTRSHLLKNVWGYDYIEGARTVDVHIRRLRSKLGSKYSALIETVRHVGYRFKRV